MTPFLSHQIHSITFDILFRCWCTGFTWFNPSCFAFWLSYWIHFVLSCDNSMKKTFSFLSLKKEFTNYFSPLYFSFRQFMWEPISHNQFNIFLAWRNTSLGHILVGIKCYFSRSYNTLCQLMLPKKLPRTYV